MSVDWAALWGCAATLGMAQWQVPTQLPTFLLSKVFLKRMLHIYPKRLLRQSRNASVMAYYSLLSCRGFPPVCVACTWAGMLPGRVDIKQDEPVYTMERDLELQEGSASPVTGCRALSRYEGGQEQQATSCVVRSERSASGSRKGCDPHVMHCHVLHAVYRMRAPLSTQHTLLPTCAPKRSAIARAPQHVQSAILKCETEQRTSSI